MVTAYDKRPWLAQYPPDMPAELPLPRGSALDTFRDTVRRQPDAPFLYYFDSTLTYRDVDEFSDALAAALADWGIRRGDRVALSLQNVPAFPIAQFAAWKCGAIVTPLSPMLRHREILKQFQDAGVRAFISLESLLETNLEAARDAGVEYVVSACDLDFLGEDRPPALAEFERRSYPDVVGMLDLCERYRGRPAPYAQLEPQDVAYLVYTSGTTGPSKGAMNTHSNVVYNIHVHKVWMRLGAGDVVLGGAPFFHITGLIEHLGVGAQVGIPIILPYRFEPGEVLRLQAKWSGTYTVMAITAYIALLNHPDFGRYDLSGLQKAYSGGAPTTRAVIDSFREKTGVSIHPVYGLTETTSPSHAVPLDVTAPPVDPDYGALSVGLPIPGAECRVVDLETGEDLPPGQTGEICIKGPMVVPGYWEKPEETARAIRDGWLHTGDVGTMTEEGWFFVVDRVKDMIVASGYKVWPREVEEALLEHAAVREAAVIGVPDPYRGETVKAYVALKEGGGASEEELSGFCKERLATYKVPRIIEFVDEVPKTATGKFSRLTLRERNLQDRTSK